MFRVGLSFAGPPLCGAGARDARTVRPESLIFRRRHEEPTMTETADITDDDLTELADDTARQAQRVVAAFSEDAEDCRMLLDMLGIGPATDED